MKLKDLLAGLNYRFMEGMDCPDYDKDISALCFDNRAEIPEDAAFVCISGTKYDTHDFADEAFRKGAACVIAEHEVDIKYAPEDKELTVIIVKDSRKALSILSANWFGNPSRSLLTIAITGTKGKSTTAGMIRSILEEDGHKTGIIGTLGVGIKDRYIHTNNTTPGPFDLQKYMRMMVDEGCDSLVMEVSSQALKQSRTAAIVFDYALFTNLEQDHIGENEHADFSEYMHCKSLLFRQCRHAAANMDDPHWREVTQDFGAGRNNSGTFGNGTGSEDNTVCEVETFSVDENNENGNGNAIYARNIRFTNDQGELGIEYDVKGAFEEHIKLSIPGRFNVYNSLAAIAVCRHIVKDRSSITSGIYKTKVLGRLEPVKISDRFSLMIDYAHNAMALESLLKTLREYNPGRLVCLFGCGGNRDKERRYEMGEVSSELSDLTVVTSDNPRFEEPLDIINDILSGVRKASGWYVVIPDRRDAIRYCIENAKDGDMIVLAGKGQEDYQEIKGVKYHMDEREIISDIVKDLKL
ncbi:MAG: UDP-N-acetylmuramoyl-L-alanyl-D-glutamate--2,6-diaminopimelate ligase [Lachnospiraceae bacterium]|nr:UDP-N-acetylmuramoyl-L-alanyl-D-glutamate--2,6-diaminopimelate ligase [Lachnospiraceae bacterium]